MANNFAAFFETLVAGASEYNKAKVGRTALLDAVYKDVKPEAARIGKTVNVYFPDVGPLQAINNGILTGTSVNPNYIPLVFQTRAGTRSSSRISSSGRRRLTSLRNSSTRSTRGRMSTSTARSPR